MVEIVAPTLFSFDDCTFHIHASKESTARVVVRRELGVSNSYTLEASLCGSTRPGLENMHYGIQHYENIGSALCDAILDYFDPDQSKARRTATRTLCDYVSHFLSGWTHPAGAHRAVPHTAGPASRRDSPGPARGRSCLRPTEHIRARGSLYQTN